MCIFYLYFVEIHVNSDVSPIFKGNYGYMAM